MADNARTNARNVADGEAATPNAVTSVFWSFATPVILLLLFFAVIALYGAPQVTERVDRLERQRDRAALEQLARDLPAHLRAIARAQASVAGDATPPARVTGPAGLDALPDISHAVAGARAARAPETVPAPLRTFTDALRADERLDTAGYVMTPEGLFAVAAVADPARSGGLLLARPVDARVLADWQEHLHGRDLTVRPASANGARTLQLAGPDGTPAASLGWSSGTPPDAVFHDLALPVSLLFAFTAFAAALILVRALYSQRSLQAAYADIHTQRQRLSEEIATRRETEARQRG